MSCKIRMNYPSTNKLILCYYIDSSWDDFNYMDMGFSITNTTNRDISKYIYVY